MKASRLLLGFILLSLIGCSGGGPSGDGEATAGASAPSTLSMSVVQESEVENLNESLGDSSQYELTQEELELLKEQNLLEDDDYKELSLLTK